MVDNQSVIKSGQEALDQSCDTVLNSKLLKYFFIWNKYLKMFILNKILIL